MKKNQPIVIWFNLILSYNVFCTIALNISIYFRYDLYLKWSIARELLTEHDTIINTGWWKSQVME